MKNVGHDTNTIPATEQAPERNRRVLPSFLVFALAAATVVLGVSGALFTDQAELDNNSIATGTIDITTTPMTLPWNITDMAPGDAQTAHVTVNNAGSLVLRYTLTSEATADAGDEDLANQLDLTIWDESAETSSGDTCAATPAATTLYEGELGTDGLTTALIGDPAQGDQGEDMTLPAGENDLLCFHLHLPSETENLYQDAGTTVDLTFFAEQTANNA